MPALITHNTFGRLAYGQVKSQVGLSEEAQRAFLLGNQGPDPLFSAMGILGLRPWRQLGHDMHVEKPVELLAHLEEACSDLPEPERTIVRAWAAGFLCHYALDSNAHPLIYRQEYDFCDAGVPGLGRDNASEVHGAIEADLDEAALFLTSNATIADVKPWKLLESLPQRAASAISEAVSTLADSVYGTSIPRSMYRRCARAFRYLQHLLYTPDNGKRAVLSTMEHAVRGKSLYNAMAWQDCAHADSVFDNAAHAPWRNPFTNEETDASFVDLFFQAEEEAKLLIEAFSDHALDEACARELSGGLNFNGAPTAAA